ncbi:MAG: NAD(P)H-hydrate epimerase [Elusimicrobiota bacterium]|nr:NAD(P)H-hydrate epimerase [Elusimicrobiota bacterium]
MPKEPVPAVWEGWPVVTAAAMRQLDFDATARFGVPAAELMERAGAAVATGTAEFLREAGVDPAKSRVVVCCGRGANGGDGLVAARHLRGAGARVTAFICPPKKDAGYPELTAAALAAAREAGVEVREAGPEAGLDAALASCDAALDALLGTGSAGKPAGAIHHMIQELNRSGKPVLAVDIPSGVHPDTGYHSGVFVNAAVTFTLGLPKKGLLAAHAKKHVGLLKVLDIGYPPELLKARSSS